METSPSKGRFYCLRRCANSEQKALPAADTRSVSVGSVTHLREQRIVTRGLKYQHLVCTLCRGLGTTLTTANLRATERTLLFSASLGEARAGKGFVGVQPNVTVPKRSVARGCPRATAQGCPGHVWVAGELRRENTWRGLGRGTGLLHPGRVCTRCLWALPGLVAGQSCGAG